MFKTFSVLKRNSNRTVPNITRYLSIHNPGKIMNETFDKWGFQDVDTVIWSIFCMFPFNVHAQSGSLDMISNHPSICILSDLI